MAGAKELGPAIEKIYSDAQVGHPANKLVVAPIILKKDIVFVLEVREKPVGRFMNA